MRKNAAISRASALLIACLALPGQTSKPAYLDPTQAIERRVEDLLARMTLAEKLGQMNMPCAYERGLGDSIPAKLANCRRFIEGTLVEGLGPGGGLFTAPNHMLLEGPRQQATYLNELQKIALEKTRLKIPVLQTEEGTHGIKAPGHTIFPEGPGIGSTWDMDLVRQIYATAAREARSTSVRRRPSSGASGRCR